MAEEGKHRVLITGVSRFLGLLLAKRLERDPAVEAVIGVDLDEPLVPIDGLEFVRADIRSPMIARVIEATKADILVHSNIGSSPARLGGRLQMKENNVIGTMQLLAAAQRSPRIKRVVMRSSTAIYGTKAGEPSVIPEDYAGRHVELGGYGKDCAEAEQYVRDFGRRRPDVGLVILRTQSVVGPTVRTNITDYLSLAVVPTALGFDPRLQLLHEEDATEALYLSVLSDESGIFNIAADGSVFLSQAIRLLGRVPLPLILPAAQGAAEVIRRLGLVDFPTDQLKLILFGRVVDIRRARERLGYEPRYTTRETIEDLRVRRLTEETPEPDSYPTWERELFEYLKRRADDGERV
ncbi:MAG: NAD-dependent epimerase/dehydratase family protein [Actinomycetota bacterium]